MPARFHSSWRTGVSKTLFGESGNYGSAPWAIAYERVPEFFYFAEYSKLPYTVKIQHVLKSDKLTEGEATARALLNLGGTENEYMLNPDYERRKRELENAANVLTDDVNNYWMQNPDWRVEPDITMRTEARPDGQHAVLDEMKLRIRDNRHSLTLPFSDHSAGSQWFFSFLAAFSEYEREGGSAGRPFMVQPGNLERVRLVEDRGKETGAVVTSGVLTRDRDTLFPLQGALGYDRPGATPVCRREQRRGRRDIRLRLPQGGLGLPRIQGPD